MLFILFGIGLLPCLHMTELKLERLSNVHKVTELGGWNRNRNYFLWWQTQWSSPTCGGFWLFFELFTTRWLPVSDIHHPCHHYCLPASSSDRSHKQQMEGTGFDHRVYIFNHYTSEIPCRTYFFMWVWVILSLHKSHAPQKAIWTCKHYHE